MPYPVDPASLEGDDLDRWYRRSSLDVDRERQAAADERYRTFFGSNTPESPADERPEAGSTSSVGGDDDVLWVANGSGGYRAVRPGQPDYSAALGPSSPRPDYLPDNPAAPEDAMVVEVGNPHNPRLRREWIAANGRPWPRTADGRNYDVAHRRAIADGGTNTLDNVEPMHPDDHRALHISNGDAARWGRRPSIARAFGGRVEPPKPVLRVRPSAPAVKLRGLGWLQIIPDIIGLATGRIRTDTWEHGMYDLAGYPAPDDEDLMIDPVCKSLFGKSAKPGQRCA